MKNQKELESEEILQKVKRVFQPYFEGYWDYDQNESVLPLSGKNFVDCDKFRVHLIEIKDKTITITLGRPGHFIGKSGNQINEFMTYLRSTIDSGIQMNIREFDPFQ